jgi:hypothetical protein
MYNGCMFKPIAWNDMWESFHLISSKLGGCGYVIMVFNATLNNIIVAVSFIGRGNRSSPRNHRPVTSHRQTLSQICQILVEFFTKRKSHYSSVT